MSVKTKRNLTELSTQTPEAAASQALKMPHAPDIERLVVGALMGDDHALAEKLYREVSFLKPAHFYTPEDRAIYGQIVELVSEGKPFDDLMLAQKLKQAAADGRTAHVNLLEQIGGVAALEKRKIDARRKKEYSIEHYARLLFRYHTQREAIEILTSQLDRVLKAKEDDIFDVRNDIADSLRATSDTSFLRAQEANKDIAEAEEEAPMRMLMGSLIWENTISFLFASTGKGKTIFGVQIAEAIGRGQGLFPYLTQFGTEYLLHNECTEGLKVGYVDLELSKHQFKKRFTNPLTKEIYKLSDNVIRISTNRNGRRRGERENAIFRDIENAVAMHKIKFLVIDNITKLSPEAKSDSKVMAPLMERFEYLRDKFGLTLLILGHTPKRVNLTQPMSNYDMAGSAIAADYCDSMFCIGEDVNDEKLKYIKQVKDRESEGTYGIDNVIRCQIEAAENGTFLSMHYRNCGNERDHLEHFMSRDAQDALIEAAVKKKAENPTMGWRTVAKEINWNLSHDTLRNKMIKYAQDSPQYEFDRETALFHRKDSSAQPSESRAAAQ